MTIPRSHKSQPETVASQSSVVPSFVTKATIPQDGPIIIREIECCNDFVAVLQSQINTSIAISDNESTFKNEGLVVGVGPGLNDGNGGRLQPTVSIGDSVMFGAKNVAAVVESASPPYEGKRVVIVAERSILCKLAKRVEYKMYDA